MTVAMAPRPDHAHLLQMLRPALSDRGIVSLQRRPYRYTTSFRLEEVDVALDDGTQLTMILKDLSWDGLLEDARQSKPPFLYEPRREVETYRRLLGPNDIGVRCYAAGDHSGSQPWLLLEKAPGVELWQVGELTTWQAVARWLAGFHLRFSGTVSAVRACNPHLLSYGSTWFTSWADRARVALETSDDPRTPELLDALDHYETVADALAALPVTFIHGEFYPSNVLVHGEGDGLRICPVDWEMAAIGPGLLDAAALAGGWRDAERASLVSAYRSGMVELGAPVRPIDDLLADVARCRLHFALQWLGWAAAWDAPPEHSQDWIGEAVMLARELLS